MKKYIIILFAFIGSFANSQEYDFQELCIACAEQNGFFCGDDPANWTQYSPNGCVPNGEGGLFYLNDGWEDCADGSDEDNTVPTIVEDCGPVGPGECDTVFVEVPIVEIIETTDTVEVEVPFYIYETEFILDTIYNTEYITQFVVDTFEVEVYVPEYIYITDTVTVYEDILDTLFIDVVEYVEVEVVIMDTIVTTEYVEIIIMDTIVDYVEVVQTEYIDCDTGMPCNSNIQEVVDKSSENSVIYNIKGQAILERKGLYIESGKIYYKK
jgi:hypothetical protein